MLLNGRSIVSWLMIHLGGWYFVTYMLVKTLSLPLSDTFDFSNRLKWFITRLFLIFLRNRSTRREWCERRQKLMASRWIAQNSNIGVGVSTLHTNISLLTEFWQWFRNSGWNERA